jgi:REP element-mobilizing transposase RayT
MKGEDSIGYFHICTDGRALPWMFQDERDFIAGVNRIGICCMRTGVKVIAFVLMDNHVHFVLQGTMPQCKAFITLYKQLTGTWIHIRYGLNDFLKLLPTNILLQDTEERLLNTIAYIDRNPVVAGYRYLTTEYPWGSARYVFKNSREERDVKPLSTLSCRSQRSMLGTRVVLPGDWRIDGKGMLCPDSFIDVSVIESYFKTPARYSYFLSKKLEGVVEQEIESSQRIFIPDIECVR